MGCISSKKELEDLYPNIFEVMNVDEHGNNINSGQLEVTDVNLIFYQRGKSPIKWPLRTLRRYGFDAEYFSFEAGRRCQTGPGIYAFRCSRAEQVFNLVQSRTQTRSSGETDSADTTSNIGVSASNRESLYLEPVRRSNTGGRLSSQNGGISRLSSVGSASGSVGPLSPQSINSAPSTLDTVPLIPPLPSNRSIHYNLYANEDIIATATQDLEETNNNKTFENQVLPTLEHSYLNSGVLNFLPKEDVSSFANENQTTPADVSSPVVDNNHVYMNIIMGSTQVASHILNVQSQSSGNLAAKLNNSLPNYANFQADANAAEKPELGTPTTPPTKSLNYIVLDLDQSKDLLKSPTTSVPLDILRRPERGYVAIDFRKTVALSHSVNPNFDTDSESSRRTRHSSTANNLGTHDRHSSSVSD